jgi:hypothetical protein
MRIRLIAVAGIAFAVGMSTVAVAAPKAAKVAPICKLVVDPANDLVSGGFINPQLSAVGRPYDPALDVVSADIANDANTLTGVIRVAKLTVGDPMAPSGRIYRLSYKIRSSGVGGELYAQITPTGNLFYGGNGTGVVDLAKNEVRISVPISRLIGHPTFGPGEAIANLTAFTDLAFPVIPNGGAQQASVGVTLYSYGGDSTGPAPKPYPVGAPSCVKVGA